MGPGVELIEKTVSMNATHYNKNDALLLYNPNFDITEFDFHNLNGFSEGMVTNLAQKLNGKALPFTISRSTNFGSGSFA